MKANDKVKSFDSEKPTDSVNLWVKISDIVNSDESENAEDSLKSDDSENSIVSEKSDESEKADEWLNGIVSVKA